MSSLPVTMQHNTHMIQHKSWGARFRRLGGALNPEDGSDCIMCLPRRTLINFLTLCLVARLELGGP